MVSFPLILQGISRYKDIYGNYIFLNIQKGSQEIVEIHNALYLSIFGERCRYPFIPHMTLGNLQSIDKMEQAYECVKDIKTGFASIIDKVSVEMIGNNGESNIIVEKNLH